MKLTKAIVLGIQVWGMLVASFALSSFVTILDNPVTQEYLVLTLAVIIFGSLGAAFFYRKENQMHGALLGVIMASVAIILDGLITVPVLLAPMGVTHGEFFSAPGFWMIIGLYTLVVYSFWRLKYRNTQQ